MSCLPWHVKYLYASVTFEGKGLCILQPRRAEALDIHVTTIGTCVVVQKIRELSGISENVPSAED